MNRIFFLFVYYNFWLVKNSSSQNWQMDGFIKIDTSTWQTRVSSWHDNQN